MTQPSTHRIRWLAGVTTALLTVSAAAEVRPKTLQTLGARPELQPGQTAPLCVVLPGGPGRMPQATQALRDLGNDLAARGWIVVVPVSPDGAPFFGDAASRVVALMERMQEDPEVRPGKVLLAGLSNGGIAALQVAGMVPHQVSGVIAVPGVLPASVRLGALQHLPVYLRIGADDELDWGNAYPSTVRQLEQVGVRLDARLLQGIGHRMPIDWPDLDRWIQRELGALAPDRPVRTELLLPPTAAPLRVWTSRKGTAMTARLSKLAGNHVVLVRTDGKSIRILRQALSPEDDAYLTALTEAADRLPREAAQRSRPDANAFRR